MAHLNPFTGEMLPGDKATNPLQNPLTTRGDIIYQGASGATRLAKPATGQLLMSGTNDPEYSDTLKGDINFAGFKAIAMACDSGATLPVAPTTGQWFLHTPTGRKVLCQYDGSTWSPIRSYGTMTLYVDGTNGTDALDKGTGTGVEAFKTGVYALDQVPPIYGGNIIIYLSGVVYSETVTISGKSPSGDFTITLQGTLSLLETISSATLTVGGNLARGVITSIGAFTGNNYQNMLAYFVTDNVYRLIDGHTKDITFNSGGTGDIDVGDIINGATSTAHADVITVTVTSGSWAGGNAAGTLTIFVSSGTWQNGENINNVTDSVLNVATTTGAAITNNNSIVTVGLLASATTQNVIIYNQATEVSSIIIGEGQKSVVINNIKINYGAVASYVLLGTNNIQFNRVTIQNPSQGTLFSQYNGMATFNQCYFNFVRMYPQSGSRFDIFGCKMKNTGGLILIHLKAYSYVGGGTILDSGSYGIYNNAVSVLDTVAGNQPRIRNCTTAGVVVLGNATNTSNVTNAIFSNNTANIL